MAPRTALTHPLDEEAIGALSGAGIERRTGTVFTLEADSEDDTRAKVLAVVSDANITEIRPADA